MAYNLKRLFGQYRILVLVAFLVLVSTIVFLVMRNRSQVISQSQPIPVDVSMSTGNGGVSEMVNGAQQVSIRLSEGQAQPQSVVPVSLVTGEPLSAEEIQQIQARLPALTAEPGDQTGFNLAQEPIPPPRTGKTIQEVFPPPPSSTRPEPAVTGPLEVLRFAPEGEIP